MKQTLEGLHAKNKKKPSSMQTLQDMVTFVSIKFYIFWLDFISYEVYSPFPGFLGKKCIFGTFLIKCSIINEI